MLPITSAARSTAAQWPPLAPLVAWEARLARRAQTNTATRLLYEFIRFGVKQAWACLFGGILVGLMLATSAFYPQHAALARYDFLSLAVQALLLALKAEGWREAGVIAIFHIVGTAMEVFKTALKSWTDASPLPLAGEGGPAKPGRVRGAARVIPRGLRRGSPHPTSADAEATFSRAREKGGHSWRWMLAENVGTVTRTWLRPGQMAHWSPVGFGKLGSWFLLQIVSYALILAVRRPEPPDDAPIRASQARHEARLGEA